MWSMLCGYRLARPDVADGGDGLQTQRVAANILNKELRVATRDCPPDWRLSVGLTTSHRKNLSCYEMFQSFSDLDSDHVSSSELRT
jgi:hypothetical protein